mgnify:FL=1
MKLSLNTQFPGYLLSSKKVGLAEHLTQRWGLNDSICAVTSLSPFLISRLTSLLLIKSMARLDQYNTSIRNSQFFEYRYNDKCLATVVPTAGD